MRCKACNRELNSFESTRKGFESGEYLDLVQGQLKNFPYDSFLLHKENAMYLYLVNGAIVANNSKKADSMINSFAKRKQSYFNGKT